jgi:hypothetical protein
MTSNGKGSRAIKIGMFKKFKGRMQFGNWGEKDARTLTVPHSFQTGVQKY